MSDYFARGSLGMQYPGLSGYPQQYNFPSTGYVVCIHVFIPIVVKCMGHGMGVFIYFLFACAFIDLIVFIIILR